MVFSIIEPIIAFWGVPAVVYGALYYGMANISAIVAAIYALQYSPMARYYYKRYALSGAVDVISLNEVDRLSSCNVELVIPHGIYGIAAKIHGVQNLAGYCALFDRKLFWLSPGARWSANMLDMDPRPLTDETVKKLMSEKRNIMALPGGFVEAAGVTTNTELIYLGKLPYWMHRCRSTGYTYAEDFSYIRGFEVLRPIRYWYKYPTDKKHVGSTTTHLLPSRLCGYPCRPPLLD